MKTNQDYGLIKITYDQRNSIIFNAMCSAVIDHVRAVSYNEANLDDDLIFSLLKVANKFSNDSEKLVLEELIEWTNDELDKLNFLPKDLD